MTIDPKVMRNIWGNAWAMAGLGVFYLVALAFPDQIFNPPPKPAFWVASLLAAPAMLLTGIAQLAGAWMLRDEPLQPHRAYLAATWVFLGAIGALVVVTALGVVALFDRPEVGGLVVGGVPALLWLGLHVLRVEGVRRDARHAGEAAGASPAQGDVS